MNRRAVLFVLLALSCATAQAPLLTPFADGDTWVVERPLNYDVGGERIVVPAGFVTDFASVPSALCAFLPASGRYLTAAVVHDFLYWDQTCTRDQADQVFLQAMNAAAVPVIKKNALYAGARLTGAIAWANNTAERSSGFVQILPRDRRRIPPDVTWRTYRNQLHREGVTEPSYEKPTPAACAAAAKLTSGT